MMTSAAARAVTMVALRVRDSQRVTFGNVWRSVALPWCAATRESLTRLKLCSVSMGLEAFAQLRAFANLARLDIVALELLVAGEPDDDADRHSAERLAVIRPEEKPDQAQATATTAPEALLYLAVRRWPRLRELKLERGSGEVVSIRDRDVPTQQLPPGWTTTFERRTRLSLTKSPVGSEKLAELVRACTRLHELTTVSALESTSLAVLRLDLERLATAAKTRG
jgi:hypothetical protein